jgi:hypothetical protein
VATKGKVEAEAAQAAIDPKVVRKVITLRKQGQGWNEVLEAIGEERPFVLRVRPLMKELDPESVRSDLGPGSPNYGKKNGTKPKVAAAKPKKNGSHSRSGQARTTTVLAKIQNLDTDPKLVLQLLDGKQIDVVRDVNGRKTKPVVYTVKKISKIANAKSGGRAVAFLDEDGKSRTINVRDIARVH